MDDVSPDSFLHGDAYTFEAVQAGVAQAVFEGIAHGYHVGEIYGPTVADRYDELIHFSGIDEFRRDSDIEFRPGSLKAARRDVDVLGGDEL